MIEQDRVVGVFSGLPPAPCVAFSDVAYTAATNASIDPMLLAAFAATETGTPNGDDGADVYQSGGPLLNNDGSCSGLCGVGPWQVDTGEHRDYTGGLDPAANASYAAHIVSEGIGKAESFLGAGATMDQIYMAAANYYNGGPGGMTGEYTTSTQPWTDGAQAYGIGLLRHFHRIQDYKAVCPNGKRG